MSRGFLSHYRPPKCEKSCMLSCYSPAFSSLPLWVRPLSSPASKKDVRQRSAPHNVDPSQVVNQPLIGVLPIQEGTVNGRISVVVGVLLVLQLNKLLTVTNPRLVLWGLIRRCFVIARRPLKRATCSWPLRKRRKGGPVVRILRKKRCPARMRSLPPRPHFFSLYIYGVASAGKFSSKRSWPVHCSRGSIHTRRCYSIYLEKLKLFFETGFLILFVFVIKIILLIS